MSEQATEVTTLCHTILAGVDGAIHYRVLAAAIQESGALDLNAIYKKPADSVYSLMVTDARRGGGRFVFLGGGMFCAAGREPPREEVAAGAELAGAKSRRHTPLTVVVEGATCADCANFAFNGVQVVGRTIGTCGSERSGRSYVRPAEAACPEWRRKSRQTEEREHKERLETLALVDKINRVVHAKGDLDAATNSRRVRRVAGGLPAVAARQR